MLKNAAEGCPDMATSTIAERAVYAVKKHAKEKGITLADEARALDIGYRVIYGWASVGHSPSAYFLQQMALAGYDVIWILTGRSDAKC